MKACPKCGKRFLGDEEFCPTDGETLMELEAGEKEDPFLNTTIDGRYRVEKKLGEGGMGVVYLATHVIIGKKCALKVLRGELNNESEVGQRFLQEAQSAAAIGNDHIIEISDFGQMSDGASYFVMEFLDGIALQDLLAESNKIENERVIDIILQCCEALTAAHNADIVHRDLKPDNIFLINKGKETDFVKILDFGIAKVARESNRLTKTGMVFGTPQYMSPEQAAGTGVDSRTDIYSLGIIMYEMLCGHVPFEADTFMGVLTKHLYEEPIPPRRLVPPVEIPRNLEAVLLKAITKKPEKRYASMADFALDLQAIRDGKTPEIVYDKLRETAATTVPPPAPSTVLGLSGPAQSRDSDFVKSKSKLPLFLGIGVAASVVIGLVLFFVLGGKSGSQVEAQPVEKIVATPEVPKVMEPKKPVVDEIPTDPKTSSVKIECSVDGAALYKDSALMGKLPLSVVRPQKQDKGATYTVKYAGHHNVDILINYDSPDAVSVDLEKKDQDVATVEPVAKKTKKKKKGKNGKSTEAKVDSTPTSESKVQIKKKKKKKSDLADPWG